MNHGIRIQNVVSMAVVVMFIFFFQFSLRFLWPTLYITLAFHVDVFESELFCIWKVEKYKKSGCRAVFRTR